MGANIAASAAVVAVDAYIFGDAIAYEFIDFFDEFFVYVRRAQLAFSILARAIPWTSIEATAAVGGVAHEVDVFDASDDVSRVVGFFAYVATAASVDAR